MLEGNPIPPDSKLRSHPPALEHWLRGPFWASLGHLNPYFHQNRPHEIVDTSDLHYYQSRAAYELGQCSLSLHHTPMKRLRFESLRLVNQIIYTNLFGLCENLSVRLSSASCHNRTVDYVSHHSSAVEHSSPIAV